MPGADTDDLNRKLGRDGRVRFAMDALGGPVAQLSSPSGTSLVALQGAQVLSWRPAGMADVLWLSPAARLGTGKAVRGGIPVCWPWFGPHPADAGKPSHGFVRAADWRPVSAEGTPAQSVLSLCFETSEAMADLWPHRARASLTVTLSDTLEIALETENLGSEPITIGGALHTYFAVQDVEKVRIDGLDGRSYIDSIDGAARKVQHGAIAIEREVDRIYVGTPDAVTLNDPLNGRCIAIDKQGSASTVVWNPWVEKARRLGDVGEDGHRRFVCIETANAGPDVAVVPPGGRHTLTARLSVSPSK